MNVTALEHDANCAEKNHDWAKAEELFLVLAHHFKDTGRFDIAAKMFMRAATAGERCEDWRMLGHLWVQCAASINHRKQGAVADLVDETDATKHYFPTLDAFAWERFTFHEQLGRAWRNAAYHLEDSGVNQTAYVQYALSGQAFSDGSLWDDASRSYYYGLLSFVERHGEIDDDMMAGLNAANRALIDGNTRRYLRRSQLHYRGIAAKLISKGNYTQASDIFAKEAEIVRRLAFIDKRFDKWLVYTLWKLTSAYGCRPELWASWVVILFFILFPIGFQMKGVASWQDSTRHATWFDYVFFSWSTVTGVQDNSFTLSLAGKMLSMGEAITGFVMLAFLITFLTKRISR